MEVYAELTQPNNSGANGLQAAALTVGTKFQNMSGMGGVYGANTAVTDPIMVPLQFFSN